MDKLIAMIKDLTYSKFWGTLVLRFENGKIVHIRKVENIKP